MDSSSIRDILTSFSPALDYFAICSGDARIKIWDTLKGQVQTEFADIASNETMSLSGNRTEKGHLSVDYTCMKWLYLDRKKKRKLGSSLLVLGTGSGDVLALDVSAGQLKWRLSDFHAGGVTSISFAEHGSRIFSAGADGMVCEIDPLMGNLLGKFRASTKGISCLAVSSDGKILATAAGQLKTFNCSDHKKIQKFSGHLGAVRFMMFSEDGKYILSSAVGERYVAIWKTDEVKKQSACCVLAMEHPAVFIDCRCFDNRGADDAGIYVMAISETGVCYFWYGQTVEELRNTEATKASLSSEEGVPKSQKGALPAIFAAKLQGIAKPASVHAFVAYGLLVKPTFQKIIVHSGADINLNCSQDGLFLARCQSLIKSKKGRDVQNRVTVLDRANAEDALLPFPKIFDIYDKKNRQQILSTDIDDEVMNDLVDGKSQANFLEIKDYKVDVEADSQTVCLEDQLRSLGILSNNDDIRMNSALESSLFSGVDLEANTLEEKRRKRKKEILPSMIKNKEKRSAVHAKLKHQKKVEKRRKLKARDAEEKRALELGEEPPTRKTPRTIENTRDPDETVCRPDDDELFVGNDADEFSSILKQESIHKILITTCRFNSGRGPAFISELLTVIPNSHYYKRGTYDLKKIVEYAKKKDFTSIIVVHTNRREPDALLVIGLPDGPTAHFKLSKLVLRKDIKNHGNPTGHMPELVLNNFTTRLGHRVGRLIQSLFPQIPEFHGRRVVTFHNQRDFIFFRHHRYIFETKGGKGSDSKCKKAKDAKSEKINQERMIARLQQCGPRFTLKLVSLQHGTFDTKGGEFEWVHKGCK